MSAHIAKIKKIYQTFLYIVFMVDYLFVLNRCYSVCECVSEFILKMRFKMFPVFHICCIIHMKRGEFLFV